MFKEGDCNTIETAREGKDTEKRLRSLAIIAISNRVDAGWKEPVFGRKFSSAQSSNVM